MENCCQMGSEKHGECCTSEKCGLNCAHCMGKMMHAGKVLVAVPMAVFGINHFTDAAQTAAYVLPGWPAATFLVYLSGAGLLLGGLAILLNKHAKLGAVVLSIIMLLIILTIDLPHVMAGGEGQQMAIMGLLKNAALLGATMLITATSCGMCCLNKNKA